MLNFNDTRMGQAGKQPPTGGVKFAGGGMQIGASGIGAKPEGGAQGNPQATAPSAPNGPLHTLLGDPKFGDSLENGMASLHPDHLPVISNFLDNVMAAYNESHQQASGKQQLDSQVRSRFAQAQQAQSSPAPQGGMNPPSGGMPNIGQGMPQQSMSNWSDQQPYQVTPMPGMSGGPPPQMRGGEGANAPPMSGSMSDRPAEAGGGGVGAAGMEALGNQQMPQSTDPSQMINNPNKPKY